MLDETALRDYCLSLKAVTEEFPFGDDVRVIKVMGRMFALIPVHAQPARISLKCDPIRAEVLRQQYAAITPGYHLNKRHWNTVLSDGTIPDPEVIEMIDHSYDLVVKGMTKAEREQLKTI